jgi:SAM-dependent methyltransferase
VNDSAAEDMPVELRLAAVLDHLGIGRADVAGRAGPDWEGLVARLPERVASLSLLCPAALDPDALKALGPRLLVVTGDRGPGAGRVRAAMALLPQAARLVLADYEGLTWADLAAERGAEIGAALRDFLAGRERPEPPAATLPGVRQGEVAGISFALQGAGPPLVLLPLDLAPTQWSALLPALAREHCTVTLGGPHLGSIASLEERGRSGYMAIVGQLLDLLAIAPGESVLELGCGSGVILRELARRTAAGDRLTGANRLIGVDRSPYLLGEARELARRAGLAGRLELCHGSGEALPLPDGSVDVALSSTVAEEGDAARMLAELVRVTRPGGRVGIVVRAVDRGCWVNLPLDPALKAKVEAPGTIGGGVGPQGCADASLYSRLHAFGLERLVAFPQLVAVRPPSPRIVRYQQQILAALTPAETEAWRRAVAAVEGDGTFFIAQPFHGAVGMKPD